MQQDVVDEIVEDAVEDSGPEVPDQLREHLFRTVRARRDRDGYHASAHVGVLSAVEILGRCRPGSHKDVTRRLQCGLRFLAEDNAVVVRVNGYSFNVQDCIDLRNFTVHGDKPHPRPISLHPRFVPALKDQIADGLDRFRRDLADDPNARDALAAARLVPIFVNSRDPIFIRDVYPMARRAEVGRMHE
jgi:hypothetical protein